MDHPHIATVARRRHDNAVGQPVHRHGAGEGNPRSPNYCDAHNASAVRERLAACSATSARAMHHAHQKGIIHRDLKPANILVESHDGKPVPKVSDFGLAMAATGMQLSDHTLFTAFGTVMGTPAYMAPEQATFNAVDVDTRADVYSLGVILYELLTGTTPITRETVKKAAFEEVLKLVREQEAPRPSSRLFTAGTTPSIAANRNIDPAKLSKLLRGDMDWVVLKALEKDRTRRYETANGLAADILRHLSHDLPVLACPPSAWYRAPEVSPGGTQGGCVAAAAVLWACPAGRPRHGHRHVVRRSGSGRHDRPGRPTSWKSPWSGRSSSWGRGNGPRRWRPSRSVSRVSDPARPRTPGTNGWRQRDSARGPGSSATRSSSPAWRTSGCASKARSKWNRTTSGHGHRRPAEIDRELWTNYPAALEIRGHGRFRLQASVSGRVPGRAQ